MPTDKSTKWLTHIRDKKYNHDLLHKAYELTQTINCEYDSIIANTLLEKGLSMASRLENLKCDSETLATAIIYPSFFHSNHAKDLIAKELGEKVAKLLVSTVRMEAIDTLQSRPTEFSQQQNQADNLRKMLLAMVDDIRGVLIKLAERLVMLLHLRDRQKDEQQHIAKQVMKLYAPLANRLGIGQFKWQMEDLAFRYLKPKNYTDISKALKMRRKDREDYIHKVINILNDLLKENHLKNVKIFGRPKHIYSIYRKIKRKRVNFNEIYDTSAVRILVPDIQNCYFVLGLVHTFWPHIPQEFDDYIAKPKPNGYRSIHTAVIGPEGKNVEIQIRTFEMDDEAELGVAAHWKYKEGTKKRSNYEKKINWLREVMNWQKEASEKGSAQRDIYENTFKDHVYVFTPNGDVLDMETGATPLDFAYHIHTEVGHRCRGAKVNGAMVPLTQSLKTGDRVEVLTTKEGHPSRDWLNANLGYLKTRVARAKIRHWFRKQDHDENLNTGQNIWEKNYRRSGVPKNALKDVYKNFNFNSVNDLLTAIGSGDIGITTILNRIRAMTAPSTEIETKLPLQQPIKISQKKSGSFISIEGTNNLLTQLARCCHPIPDDPIIGYVTKGRGVSIHRQDCHNIKAVQKLRSERIIEVSWGKNLPQKYPVALTIKAENHPRLLRDISNVIAAEQITILSLNTRTNKIRNYSYIDLTVEINRLELLDKLIREINQISDVIAVRRRK